MLKEARRLFDLGLSLHWLRPNSKMPLAAGWTKRPRYSWPELEDTYYQGVNLGVRLGRTSELPGGGCLAVVDCDVKSPEPRHQAELVEKLKILGLPPRAPLVASGRGNGSSHVYIRTQAPATTRRLAQSAEKVRVLMPSVSPSKKDAESLSPTELEEGYRMRAAWEISLLGDGAQVVLPPSTHPDTGQPYEWALALNQAEDIPAWEDPGGSWAKAEVSTSGGLENLDGLRLEDLDLDLMPLPAETVEVIRTGAGASDRSGALLSVALQCIRAGLLDWEILSILTDKRSWLGACAYDHAHTTSRKRAAEWVRKYTLVKARAEAQDLSAFSAEVEVSRLDEAQAQAQAQEILGTGGWERMLSRTKEGALKPTYLNAYLLVKHCLDAEGEGSILHHNEFLGSEYYDRDTPWGGKAGAELGNADLVLMKTWLAQTYKIELGQTAMQEIAIQLGQENKRHPVREYLAGLQWDGKTRLDSWLRDYLGAEGPELYLAAVGRKWLTAMVARVMEPGCKYDQVVILEGRQGIGKSTAVRMLSDPWFSDSHLNIGDKDAVVGLRGVWCLELGELSGMRKADADHLKEFVSSQFDRIRVPYGRRSENFPRQCVFVGTTNETEYLKDRTGNRRFWPVRMTGLDFEGFPKVRDQLLAEAKFCYELGEALYLSGEEAREARGEQEDRQEQTLLPALLQGFAEKPPEGFPNPFSLTDLVSDFGPLAGPLANGTRGGIFSIIGSELTRLGFTRTRTRGVNSRKWAWHFPKAPLSH